MVVNSMSVSVKVSKVVSKSSFVVVIFVVEMLLAVVVTIRVALTVLNVRFNEVAVHVSM